MEQEVLKTLNAAAEQKLESRPEHLTELANKLAVWAITSMVDEGGSRLQSRTYALAGAIMDWKAELYPEGK